MIIVRLQGGLGNQFFQYAFGKAMGLSHQLPVRFDLDFFARNKENTKATFRNLDLKYFFSDITEANIEDYRKVIGYRWIKELGPLAVKMGIFQFNHFYREKNTFAFTPKWMEGSFKEGYMDGYWQHFQYFNKFRTQIFGDLINDLRDSHKHNINGLDSLAIHIRRGDFVTNSYHPVLGSDYYYSAMDLISAMHNSANIEVYLFSDDIEWCRKHIQEDKRFHTTHYVENGNAVGQFRQMACCNHFIIANSTFSWWPAWLSFHSNKTVVAPRIWVNDRHFSPKLFYPESWKII